MDPTRDNPIFRFKAAFWGLGLFALFAVALAVAWLFSGGRGPTLEEAAAAARYQKAAEVEAAQRAQLAWKEIEPGKVIQAPPPVVFGHVGGQLLAAKPVAVERPDQVVPGTPTAKRLEEEAAAAAAAAGTPAGDAPAGDAPAGDAPAGDKPAGDAPAGDAPAGGKPAGDAPAGDAPAGDAPAGDKPAGDAPAGDAPAGETPGSGAPAVEPPEGGTTEAPAKGESAGEVE